MLLLIIATLSIGSHAQIDYHTWEQREHADKFPLMKMDCKPGILTVIGREKLADNRLIVPKADRVYWKTLQEDGHREEFCRAAALDQGKSYVYGKLSQGGTQDCYLYKSQLPVNFKPNSSKKDWTTCRIEKLPQPGKEYFDKVDRLGEECWTDGGCRGDGEPCQYCGTHWGEPMLCCRKGWSGKDDYRCEGAKFSPKTEGHQCVEPPIVKLKDIHYNVVPHANINMIVYLLSGLGFAVVAYGAVKHYIK